MTDVTLVIGSKRLSSWSLRPWLFLQHHGVNFREVVIDLTQPGARAQVLRYSPSGRLPVMVSGDFAVWDSLAVCEFAAEWFALPGAWPMAPGARAMARAAVCEMHSGFAHLRREWPFDATRERLPAVLSEAARADVLRVRAVWRGARTRYGGKGPWLFGNFGIADAMFAPVALRMGQYGYELDGPERDFHDAVVEHHAVEAWVESAVMDAAAGRGPGAPKIEKLLHTGENTATAIAAGAVRSVMLPP